MMSSATTVQEAPDKQTIQAPSYLQEHTVGQDLLNLGCGLYGFEGWHNVDVAPTDAADQMHDLDEMPWPWDAKSWDTVLLDNVLEHLADPVEALWWLHRITKPGGRVIIRVPHRDSPAAYRPGHKSYWNEDSLNGFTDPQPAEARNAESEVIFRVVHVEVHHRHPWCWHQRKYLGRELVGWWKQAILWVLEPHHHAHVSMRPRGLDEVSPWA